MLRAKRCRCRQCRNSSSRSIRVAAGATVAPGGEALLELGDPSHLPVVAQVAESDLARIAIGQQAEVTLPALAASVGAGNDGQ